MAAGLQVIGDNGTAQIDENYSNYHLVQSFQVVQGDGFNKMISGSLLSPNAVWAVYMTQGNACPSPGYYRTQGRQFKYWFLIGAPQVVNMQVYVFDVLAPQGSKYGLEVYNAQGTLVYDGQGYPMRVIEPVQWLGSGARPATAGIRTAVAPLYGGRRVQDDGQQSDYESWSLYMTGGGTSAWSYFEEYISGPGSGVPVDYGDSGFFGLMLDVTDIPLTYLRLPK